MQPMVHHNCVDIVVKMEIYHGFFATPPIEKWNIRLSLESRVTS
jgi:hypothetical protein